MEVEIISEGKPRDKMSFEEGLKYLRQYSGGTLGHRDMERLDFLFLRNDGSLAFCDWSENQKVEIITDLNEFSPDNDWDDQWCYLPASEFSILIDGEKIWEEIRAVDPAPLSLPTP